MAMEHILRKGKIKMRNKYSLLQNLALCSSLILGCSGRETRKEVSDVLHEDAVVVDVVYTLRDMEVVQV